MYVYIEYVVKIYIYVFKVMDRYQFASQAALSALKKSSKKHKGKNRLHTGVHTGVFALSHVLTLSSPCRPPPLRSPPLPTSLVPLPGSVCHGGGGE